MPQSALIRRLHDRFVAQRPPLWVRPSMWYVAGAVIMVSAFAFFDGDGRGRGVFFTYDVLPGGRAVLNASKDATPGATARVSLSANIWSTGVFGFRRWRVDVAAGNSMGPFPPAGMTTADIDRLRREGCARLIELSRGDAAGYEAFVISGTGELGPPLAEDLPALQLMADGGGFGCGEGLRGVFGAVLHRASRWLFRVGAWTMYLGCGLMTARSVLRARLWKRIDRAARAQCPVCVYPQMAGTGHRCSECGADAAGEVQRCHQLLGPRQWWERAKDGKQQDAGIQRTGRAGS